MTHTEVTGPSIMEVTTNTSNLRLVMDRLGIDDLEVPCRAGPGGIREIGGVAGRFRSGFFGIRRHIVPDASDAPARVALPPGVDLERAQVESGASCPGPCTRRRSSDCSGHQLAHQRLMPIFPAFSCIGCCRQVEVEQRTEAARRKAALTRKPVQRDLVVLEWTRLCGCDVERKHSLR